MIIKNKKIICSDLFQKLLNAILIVSVPFFTLLLSNKYEKEYIILGVIISFISMLVMIIKKVRIKEINIYQFLFSLYIALFSVKNWIYYCDEKSNLAIVSNLFIKFFNIHLNGLYSSLIIGCLALPFTIFLIYLFIARVLPIVKQFFMSFTKCEKIYFIVTLTFATILTVSISFFTTAFFKPYSNSYVQAYDVIYTTDTGSLASGDAFFNVSFVENDIRQPLFGVFSLPFSIPAKILGDVAFFIPNNYGYEVFLVICQFLLLTVTTIMLGRLLKLNDDIKKYLYIFVSFSFPYLLFGLIVEQYVIGLFYLILAIYYYFNNKQKINYFYVPAVGTLVTSGVIFPLLTKIKNFKLWIKSAFLCLGLFLLILTISGQFSQLLVGPARFLNLTESFSGTVTLADKFYQFTYFVKGLFLANNGVITDVFYHKSYQLVNFNHVSYIGIFILFLSVLSFVLNFKNNMAKFSFFWVIFSIIILLILGWGTSENGLILYSLYFAFAYFILYFLFLQRLFKNIKLFKLSVLASVIIMCIFNFANFIEILKFAVTYY